MKRLSAEVPVASSPITTRWQQSQTRDLPSHSFGEEHSTSDLESSRSVLKITPEKGTLILGEVIDMPLASFEMLNIMYSRENLCLLETSRVTFSQLLFCFSSFELEASKVCVRGMKQKQKKTHYILNMFLRFALVDDHFSKECNYV